MFDFLSTTKILALLVAYRYAIFFPLTVIEGPIATIIAGFLASLNLFNFWLVYLIAVVGDLAGDLIYYVIGSVYSGRIEKKGRFLGIKVESLNKLKGHFQSHAGKTFIFGKLTHAIGAAILIAGGMAKVPVKKFLWWNFLGTLPKALAFLIVGYYFGRAYQQVDKYLGYSTLAMFFAIILVAAVYFLMRKIREDIKID